MKDAEGEIIYVGKAEKPEKPRLPVFPRLTARAHAEGARHGGKNRRFRHHSGRRRAGGVHAGVQPNQAPHARTTTSSSRTTRRIPTSASTLRKIFRASSWRAGRSRTARATSAPIAARRSCARCMDVMQHALSAAHVRVSHSAGQTAQTVSAESDWPAASRRARENVSREDYRALLDQAIAFLNGKYKPVIAELTERMNECAKAMNYEGAGRVSRPDSRRSGAEREADRDLDLGQ